MNNIGLFGTNLAIAAHKVQTAATPAEKRFRTALINNDQAREVVDKVDFVQSQMQALDGKSLDGDAGKNSVSVDGQAKKLGRIGRWLGAANAPLEAITTQAPASQDAPTVKGHLADSGMEVSVQDSNRSTQFSLQQRPDGTKVYSVGDQSVTMMADGALLLS